MKTIYDRMRMAICTIACAFLAYLTYSSFIFPLEWPEDYSESMMLALLAMYVVAARVFIMIVRCMPEKTLPVLVIIMLIWAFCVQIYIAHEMQLMPDVDLKNIREQDRYMVENGLHIFTDEEYFATYPNNIGLAIVIYWVFRIARACGISSCELAGGLFNVCMNMLTYVCAYRIVSRYSSKKCAVLFLGFIISNPVLYAYASYYYTDTVSMGMTTAAVELFLLGTEERWGRWQNAILMASGILLLLAVHVRVTSLFIVLAAIVYVVLRGRVRQLLHPAIPFLVGILVGCICYSGIYHYHVAFDSTDRSMPWQSWVAMGVDSDNDGRYNEDIYDAVMAEPDHQSKVDLSVRIIRENVAENGVIGSLDLVLRKEAVTWARGTKMYFVYVPFVKDKNPIYDWIIGDHKEYLANYMLAYNAVFLLLILISLVASFTKGGPRDGQTILMIYWLGAVLFYVFWEAHPRQSVSYLALMSMMIVPLLEWICNWGDHRIDNNATIS